MTPPKLKRLCYLTLVLLFLATSAKAWNDFYKEHQNTEPWPEFRRVDCGALNDAIALEKYRIQMLLKAAKQDPGQRKAIRALLPNEISRLEEYLFIYRSVCREA